MFTKPTQTTTTLVGCTVLVAGGTGGVGEGIVRYLLSAGATVFVPSRTEIKANQLREYVDDIKSGSLKVIIGNVGTESGALEVTKEVEGLVGSLDLVIACLGGWWRGKALSELDLRTWDSIIANNLTSHFVAMRQMVPLLDKTNGMYLHINGQGANSALPMAAPIGMMAAAQKSMILSLAAEQLETGLRVRELLLGPVATRRRKALNHAKSGWLVPEEVGYYIHQLYINSYKGDEIIHNLREALSLA